MRRFVIPAILLLLACVPAFAAIEYDFHQTSRSEVDAIPSIDVSAKAVVDGDRSRVDYQAGTLYAPGTFIITLDSSRRMYVVDSRTKTYSEVNFSRVASAVGGQQIEVKNLKTDFQKLGDHPVVAGYPTDHFRLQTSYDMTMVLAGIPLTQAVNTVIDKWTTNAFGDIGEAYLASGSPRTGNPSLDQLMDVEASKIKGFPLRQTITITTGGMGESRNPKAKLHVGVRRQTSEMTVSSVRTVEVKPSYFEIPAGYTKSETKLETTEPNVHQLSMEPAGNP